MRILHGGSGGAAQWWPVIERCCGRVLRQPADWICWNNGSNALWLLDQPHEASRWAARAVTLQPDHPSPWRSWGNALTDLGEFARADQAYATSLRLADSPETAFNASKVLLAMGEYRKGYLQAERRLDSAQWAPHRSGAFWHGWPQQRQLILWTEQGFGDGLQALRWLIPLQQRWPGDVLLEVEPCLVPLLQEGLAWMDRPPTVRAKAPMAPRPSSSACHGSLLSLGALLGVDLVPEAWAGGGYLRLKGDLAPRAGRRPRVGVVWASGRFLDGHVQEREYWRKSLMGSTLLALLHGLADRPIDLVNLQFGADRQEAAAWSGAFQEELPADADFLATAQAMQSLDLVISVDTAAAHLAGAMGLPVWILLPWAAEARWGRGTSTTPWYPSARLLRQPSPADWEGLIRLALARLDLWLCSW
jgi:hypothetical protein